MIRKAIGFVLLLFFTGVAWGQKPQDDLSYYKKKHPSASRIRSLDSYKVTIDFDKNDSIIISTTIEVEDFYTDKHASRYSKRSVESSFFEKITDISSYVEYPKNSKKYKKEKVKDFETKKELSKQYFYDDTETISFEFPNLREGAKSYLSYSTELKTPQLIGSCFFGNIYPIEKQIYSVKVHNDIVVDFKKFNGVDDITSYTKVIEGDYIIHTWTAKDIEEIEFEHSSPSLSASTPHIYPIIKSYSINGKKVSLLEDLDALHNWYTDLLNLAEVEESEALKQLVDSLVTPGDGELEKVRKIYSWVQKRVKYIAYEDGLGGFVPRPPQLVYQRMHGDCKDMSFLLVKMLEYAGLKGYVSWVGTRSKPYSYSELPSPGCDNHMIATYKSNDGEWYFLDATGTYTPFGYPSEFIQGKEVLVHISDDDYELVKVDFVPANKNVEYDSLWVKIEGNNLSGRGKSGFSGYEYSNLEYLILDRDSISQAKTLRSILEKGSNKFFFELEKMNFELEDQGTIVYNFTIEDYINSSANTTFINLNLEKVLSDAKIEDTRKFKFERDYLKEIRRVYVLDLGDEYVINNLPENETFQRGGNRFDITYTLENNRVIYTLDIYITEIYLEKDKFQVWNDMIKQLNKKYKEVITLTKK